VYLQSASNISHIRVNTLKDDVARVATKTCISEFKIPGGVMKISQRLINL
jgi:hypothetical protein